MKSPEEKSPAGGGAATAERRVHDDFYCPDCGYSLRGLTAERCPECGLGVDGASSAAWIIPWEHRREIGRFRAYWRTVAMVSFRHKRFRRAMLRPVAYPDAQRFRWITIAQAMLMLLLPAALAPLLNPQFAKEIYEDPRATLGWLLYLTPIAPALFLVLASGLPSYLYHPRFLPVPLQNRGIAMSYYACAALAWMWVPALSALSAIALYDLMESGRGNVSDWAELLSEALSLLSALLVPVLLIVWWLNLVRLARAVLRRSGAVLRVAVGVPVLWLLAAGVSFVALPVIVLFLVAVVYSLSG